MWIQGFHAQHSNLVLWEEIGRLWPYGLKIQGPEYQSQLSQGAWGIHLLTLDRLCWGKLANTRMVTLAIIYIESGNLKWFH